MNSNLYQKEVNKAAKKWLSEIDIDEFVKEFIELEKNAVGPTVQEMFGPIIYPRRQPLQLPYPSLNSPSERYKSTGIAYWWTQ